MDNNETKTLDEFPLDIDILTKMGMEVLVREAGRVKVKLPFTPNKNHVGTIYAGSLFSVAEFPAAIIISDFLTASNIVIVVAEMNIRYRKPATGNVYVDMCIDAKELSRLENEALDIGKSSLVHEQSIVNEDNEVIATSQARYVCLKQ